MLGLNEIVPVLFDVGLPAFRNSEIFINRVDRADGQTRATVNTPAWIDKILLVLFTRIYAGHRADHGAGGIFFVDAGFRDDIGHRTLPLANSRVNWRRLISPGFAHTHSTSQTKAQEECGASGADQLYHPNGAVPPRSYEGTMPCRWKIAPQLLFSRLVLPSETRRADSAAAPSHPGFSLRCDLTTFSEGNNYYGNP